MVFKQYWGDYKSREVYLFRITNASGAYVELINLGATIVSIYVPNKYGRLMNTVLGFPTLDGYIKDNCYLGRTIGRFANRISQGRFFLDDWMWNLETNDGKHNNHSGSDGFHDKVMDFREEEDGVVFFYTSPHLEGGFPGTVDFQVKYSWSHKNELLIEYGAVSDRSTYVNFTNHSYFNLEFGSPKILAHRLVVESELMIENTSEHIPSRIISINGRNELNGKKVGHSVLYKEMRHIGLNNYYILKRKGNDKPSLIRLEAPRSGIELNICTSYPGVQVYTGDYLKTAVRGNEGMKYGPFEGLCLECHNYPDFPNQPNFPKAVLFPNMQMKEFIKYKFGVLEE
ncbi:aldose epimerase family protein [Echinicola sp. 20G]|uniref:aldose epimerase family protein n=1 Tax=Echinicola sp. 20G TaxID=2781961 RepID=UPI00190FF151|nr:aldose epimerase family protein [Echinicola sp. 20G]